ncbi:MAG: methionine aminopeptidase [Patescibacteria group bacterium]|nr:MAG: methionine aminopeptidase [Patescibacteria group bacterium]
MIDIKTKEEIEIMKKGGKILAESLFETLRTVRPGITEAELDRIAEKAIRRRGGEPGFMRVPGYKHTICVATNEVVVHGIPGDRILKEGDIICIDCGVYYGGLHTDMAETIIVGSENSVQKEVRDFLRTCKLALQEAIAVAKAGNRVGHISKTIQDIVEGKGYSIVRSLVGHGVGRELHEEPEVPGFLQGKIARTPLLKEGMTIAVEVIATMGSPEVCYANEDGWTIKTVDNSLSAVFERTILITKDKPLILTQ